MIEEVFLQLVLNLRIPGAWKPCEAEVIETDSYALTNVCIEVQEDHCLI